MITCTNVSILLRCNVSLLLTNGVTTGVAVTNTLDEPFSLLSSVALIKPSKDILDAHYLQHYLNSSVGFKMITNQMTGTAIKRIVLYKIRTSRIALPPISEQKKITKIINPINRKISLYSHYKIALETLKKGLMQQLLTGKIRVKV